MKQIESRRTITHASVAIVNVPDRGLGRDVFLDPAMLGKWELSLSP